MWCLSWVKLYPSIVYMAVFRVECHHIAFFTNITNNHLGMQKLGISTSTITHLSGIFLPMDIPLEYWIEHVSREHLCEIYIVN